MKNKRILITGAAGTIGSELVRQLAETNDVYGLDSNEMGLHRVKRFHKIPVRVGDIRNRETLRNVFDDFKPQYVFHAAAYKSVDMMEYVPEEAISTNVIGTLNVLEFSKIHEVERFVYISTDKVVNTRSIMGKTKSLGETMTVNSGQGYVAVRFGNVIGSRGSLIEIWEEELNAGKAMSVTENDMRRFFMTVQEAVDLVIEATSITAGLPAVICFGMGKPVRIRQLAESIIKNLREVGFEATTTNIGNRGGEVLEEKLMTEEEQKVAQKIGNFFIIK